MTWSDVATGILSSGLTLVVTTRGGDEHCYPPGQTRILDGGASGLAIAVKGRPFPEMFMERDIESCAGRRDSAKRFMSASELINEVNGRISDGKDAYISFYGTQGFEEIIGLVHLEGGAWVLSSLAPDFVHRCDPADTIVVRPSYGDEAPGLVVVEAIDTAKGTRQRVMFRASSVKSVDDAPDAGYSWTVAE